MGFSLPHVTISHSSLLVHSLQSGVFFSFSLSWTGSPRGCKLQTFEFWQKNPSLDWTFQDRRRDSSEDPVSALALTRGNMELKGKQGCDPDPVENLELFHRAWNGQFYNTETWKHIRGQENFLSWLEVKMRKCSLLQSLEPGIKNWIHLSRQPWLHLCPGLFVFLILNVQRRMLLVSSIFCL